MTSGHEFGRRAFVAGVAALVVGVGAPAWGHHRPGHDKGPPSKPEAYQFVPVVARHGHIAGAVAIEGESDPGYGADVAWADGENWP